MAWRIFIYYPLLRRLLFRHIQNPWRTNLPYKFSLMLLKISPANAAHIPQQSGLFSPQSYNTFSATSRFSIWHVMDRAHHDDSYTRKYFDCKNKWPVNSSWNMDRTKGCRIYMCNSARLCDATRLMHCINFDSNPFRLSSSYGLDTGFIE